jgi:hypothetical protein
VVGSDGTGADVTGAEVVGSEATGAGVVDSSFGGVPVLSQ